MCDVFTWYATAVGVVTDDGEDGAVLEAAKEEEGVGCWERRRGDDEVGGLEPPPFFLVAAVVLLLDGPIDDPVEGELFMISLSNAAALKEGYLLMAARTSNRAETVRWDMGRNSVPLLLSTGTSGTNTLSA